MTPKAAKSEKKSAKKRGLGALKPPRHAVEKGLRVPSVILTKMLGSRRDVEAVVPPG
jgi:hypothetical protein